MRRTTATLSLLGVLAMTGCAATAPSAAPESTGTAVAAASDPTDLLDCSPQFKKDIDPNLFDPNKCWTSADVPDAVTTHGDTVFELVQQHNGSGRKVVARNAADGKKLWTSSALEGVASGPTNAPQLRDFSARGTEAIAIGYGLAQGYRVIVLDAKTGKELGTSDAKTAPKEVTWGSGAVALKGDKDEVSILSVTAMAFKELPPLPWDAKAPAANDTLSPTLLGNRVLYVTPDRLVLDMAAPGTAGPVLTDAAGAKLGNLPKGNGMPAAAFCGDYGLIDKEDGSKPLWVELGAGKPAAKPGCTVADYVTSGPANSSSAGVGALKGVIAPDGKVIAVPGAGTFSTADGSAAPLTKGFSGYGISGGKLYDPLATYDLATGQGAPHKDMTGVTGLAILGSSGTPTAIFRSSSWGLGGAAVK